MRYALGSLVYFIFWVSTGITMDQQGVEGYNYYMLAGSVLGYAYGLFISHIMTK